uniref:LAGLIDADG endonuclease n=1 Tax=Fusarium ficicrescens TaxID=1688603 RepID=A0A6M4AZ85_9HYPO|nr:LAGLIDADG endonuclease [Fusarium ficicrescens]
MNEDMKSNNRIDLYEMKAGGVKTQEEYSDLGFYLAGLIEGDGNIWIPKSQRSTKNELTYPSIAITFHRKELPLFERIKCELGGGYIYKSRSDNGCRFRIVKTEILIKVVNLINGKFRTPKINSLHKIIDFINIRHNLSIEKLPLNKDYLGSNPWLSGFVDADGGFYIGLRGRYSIKNKDLNLPGVVICRFHLTQRITDKLTNESCIPFMTEIANYFTCKLYVSNHHNIANMMVSNQNVLKIINDYFDRYPLMTSKYLNYLSFLEGMNYARKCLSNDEIERIQFIKSGMNIARSHYNWDHLNNFYK